MSKYKPWRRKAKLKDLAEGMTTATSFAVVGSPEKFKPRFHAYKVYQALRDLGAPVYAVAPGLERLGSDKVYPDLPSLTGKVEVVIPCLPAPFALSIVEQAKEAGAKAVWFQPRTSAPEAWDYCEDNGIKIIEGCTLIYREFDNLLKFSNPCFWHSKTIFYKQRHL